MDLANVVDDRGMLTAFEVEGQVPFDIRRLFYVQHVPPGSVRGQHAQDARQFLACLAGSVDIDVDDGCQQARVRLDHPAKGLCVAPLVWVELTNFSDDAVLLVLASEPYDPALAIRDHARFLEAAAAR